MTLPKTSASYPPEMLAAIDRAHAVGEVVIPTMTPMQMRLQFQGLRGAMRKEGKSELVDMVSFHITEKEFIIKLRAASPMMADIAKALEIDAPRANAVEEAEASLMRILGKTQ